MNSYQRPVPVSCILGPIPSFKDIAQANLPFLSGIINFSFSDGLFLSFQNIVFILVYSSRSTCPSLLALLHFSVLSIKQNKQKQKQKKLLKGIILSPSILVLFSAYSSQTFAPKAPQELLLSRSVMSSLSLKPIVFKP